MIPRAQMDVIDIDETPEKFIPHVIETGALALPGDRARTATT